MKFLTIAVTDMANAQAVAQATDKVWASPPPGIKAEAIYICLGTPIPGVPPNTLVSVSIYEAESAEALAAVSYPMMLAGQTIYRVPILEVPVAAIAKEEKKYRG